MSNEGTETEKSGTAKKLTIGASAALGSTVLFAPAANAAPFTVTTNADDGPGSLRQAVEDADAAAGPDTITFGAGVTGAITLTTGEIVIDDAALDIEGPGAQTLAVDGNGTSRIFSIPGTDHTKTTIIRGLTLRNGSTTGEGGAIVMNNGTGGTLTLRDSVLSGNHADDDGGAVYTGDGTVNAYDTVFAGNTAGSDGGALWLDANLNQQTFRNVTISGNTAAGDGGGIVLYSLYSPQLIEDSTISDNTAGDTGGGVYFYTTYDLNTPSGTAGLVIRNTTIADNSATTGGGAYFSRDSSQFERGIEIENVTVSGNDATGEGGGISLPSLDPGTKPEATISIDSATIAENTAATGGGLFRVAPVTELKNSIVANNTNGDLAEAPASPGDFPLAFDLIENPGTATTSTVTPGSNLTGVDPALGPLGDNGGPVDTQEPDAGSPALDAGSTTLNEDARGFTRPVDYPAVANSTAAGANGADIGAVELQDTEVTDPVITARKPQLQGDKIRVKVKMGASEPVTARANGRIHSKRGFPITHKSSQVAANDTVKLVLKPRDEDAVDKIQRSLENGKKVKAKIRANLKDAAGNIFRKKLTVKLKPKKGR